MRLRSKISLLMLAVFAWAQMGAAEVTNKQLRIGVTQEFENLNPIIAQMLATNFIARSVNHQIIALNEKWEPTCFLCTEIPSIEKGTAKIYTEKGQKKLVANWEIKEGANWGDGKPVTGHDVKLSWEIGKSENVAVGEKDIYMRIEKIEVDKKNPKKFVTYFKQARYDFYQLYTFYIVPAHIEGPVFQKTKHSPGAYEKQTEYSTNPTNPGLYNGPYRLTEIKLGSHVVVGPNKHYYGNQPKIQQLVFKLIPDTATLEANLLSGTIDMISRIGLKLDQALSLEKRIKSKPDLAAKYKINFREGMVYEHIDLNLRNPKLKDVRVRKALVYAIDRVKLTQALFEGRQRPALHNIHPLDPYYSDQVPQYEYSPEKAKKLLDEAGWKVGAKGIRSRSGEKLSFTIMTTAQDKTRELVQVFLQDQWKKVGIDIKIKNEPARVFFGETVRKAKYPAMAMFAWISSPDNPPKSTVHSHEIPSAKNAYSGQNSGGWVNKNVDKLLDEIYLTFDFEKRKEMMSKVQYHYADEVPVVPLYLRSDITVTPANLKGMVMTGHQFGATLHAERWELESSKLSKKSDESNKG